MNKNSAQFPVGNANMDLKLYHAFILHRYRFYIRSKKMKCFHLSLVEEKNLIIDKTKIFIFLDTKLIKPLGQVGTSHAKHQWHLVNLYLWQNILSFSSFLHHRTSCRGPSSRCGRAWSYWRTCCFPVLIPTGSCVRFLNNPLQLLLQLRIHATSLQPCMKSACNSLIDGIKTDPVVMSSYLSELLQKIHPNSITVTSPLINSDGILYGIHAEMRLIQYHFRTVSQWLHISS